MRLSITIIYMGSIISHIARVTNNISGIYASNSYSNYSRINISICMRSIDILGNTSAFTCNHSHSFEAVVSKPCIEMMVNSVNQLHRIPCRHGCVTAWSSDMYMAGATRTLA